MEIAFQDVKAALDSVGATFSDIVNLNTFIVDIRTNIAHYRGEYVRISGFCDPSTPNRSPLTLPDIAAATDHLANIRGSTAHPRP
jgi:enamine deaminase RidA (YjgF/YER057c/UK114 family)